MALVPNRPAQMVRRITTYSLIADVVVSLLIGLVISSFLGWVVFILGLIVTAVVWFNFQRTMRMKGMRR
jgi:1,4-dihydroxy-2-naphthoate octaprenyltransferase